MQQSNYLKDRRIITLIVIMAILAILDLHYGLHFGIEFEGGTQIPLALDHPVNATAMSALISSLSQRLDTFGLRQVTIEGIGNSEVYVVIPSTTQSSINSTINIISSQGRFDGIVAGKEALNGSSILKGSIGTSPPTEINGTAEWIVTFFVTSSAASSFAKTVFGQANQPLYMFLDRPTSAFILMPQSLLGNTSLGVNSSVALSAMQAALSFGNQSIPVIPVTNNSAGISHVESFVNSSNGRYSTAFVPVGLNASLLSFLAAHNITATQESNANLTPQYTTLNLTDTIVESWTMVGLLSSPVLNPSITNGSILDSYEISGASPTTISRPDRLAYAATQEKTISSILSGGALPVALIPETPTAVPPTLGKESLYVSGIAGIAAILGISVFIMFRYRKPFLILPILLTTFAELFIIVSIIGLVGTIDLAAVAGMIAVVGTGVDAQIIITDEIIAQGSGQASAKMILGKAFYIIWLDAAMLVIAMMPLFFSTSLVTIIGFSEATIIGALLGVLVTRPAYGAILGRHFG